MDGEFQKINQGLEVLEENDDDNSNRGSAENPKQGVKNFSSAKVALTSVVPTKCMAQTLKPAAPAAA